MWNAIRDYSVVNFHLMRTILWQRHSNDKLTKMPWCAVLLTLQYVQYSDMYENVVSMMKKCIHPDYDSVDYMYKYFEDMISVDENTTTGIVVNYVSDPINILKIAYKRGDKIRHCAMRNSCLCDFMECLRYLMENNCSSCRSPDCFALHGGSVRCAIYIANLWKFADDEKHKYIEMVLARKLEKLKGK